MLRSRAALFFVLACLLALGLAGPAGAFMPSTGIFLGKVAKQARALDAYQARLTPAEPVLAQPAEEPGEDRPSGDGFRIFGLSVPFRGGQSGQSGQSEGSEAPSEQAAEQPEYTQLTAEIWSAAGQGGGDWRQEWSAVPAGDETAERRVVVAAALAGSGRLLGVYPADTTSFPAPPTDFLRMTDPRRELAGMGVDTELRCWAFHDSRPCLVFGSATGLDARPQVWFDAETYVPLRIVRQVGGETVALEFTQAPGPGALPVPRSGRLRFGDPADPDYPREELEFSLAWQGFDAGRVRQGLDPSAFQARFAVAAPSGLELPAALEVLERGLPVAR